MAIVKCNKCGANIPSNAAFCPGCGAPAEQPTQQVQSAPEPVPQPAPKPTYRARPPRSMSGFQGSLAGLADTLFSKFFILLGLCVGILLAFIGNIILLIGQSWSITADNVLDLLGFTMIGFLLLGGGLVNRNINHFVRAGMIAIGGYMLVTVLVSTGLSSWWQYIPS